MQLDIVGAGFTGLLAAHAFPAARIYEHAPQPHMAHRALLRFRSNIVAQLTGIDFRAVTVRKGIWFNRQFVQPNIQLANLYAQKVTGQLTGDRSIWNLDAVERWIAPEDFYERLIGALGDRIEWDCDYFKVRSVRNLKGFEPPFISTAPLPVTLKALGVKHDSRFNRSSIFVARYRLEERTDVHQTIYFPDPELQVYRASITGSLLIVEGVAKTGEAVQDPLFGLPNVFGLRHEPKYIDTVGQQYGKIVPLPGNERKALLHLLTLKHNAFSLGRFACWRNILLDDVVQDIQVVRRLMKAGDYERTMFASA